MSDPIRKNLIIIEIRDTIDLSLFCCENEELNKFLKEKARFNEENFLSKVYLYINKNDENVIGFVTLSNYMLRLADSKQFGIQKVPAALLGRIAIDNKYRGQNLGKDLIEYVLGKCHFIKQFIGCRILVVEVDKEAPIKNYLSNYGFELLHESKGFHILGFDLLI